MPLTPDQIKLLLSKPEKRGGRSSTGKKIDTSVRDYSTWFKLATKILEKEQATAEESCSNPNCLDPRSGRVILIAEVNGENMCRYCFLDGYMNISNDQLVMSDSDG